MCFSVWWQCVWWGACFNSRRFWRPKVFTKEPAIATGSALASLWVLRCHLWLSVPAPARRPGLSDETVCRLCSHVHALQLEGSPGLPHTRWLLRFQHRALGTSKVEIFYRHSTCMHQCSWGSAFFWPFPLCRAAQGGLVCSGGVSRVVLMTQGIHLQFPSAGGPGLSSSGSYLAPVLGQETVGWISGGGCWLWSPLPWHA